MLHVVGQYEPAPVEQQDGVVGQRWVVDCAACGEHQQGCCASGAVRLNIMRFSGLHEHGRAF
jgi:hypothetical protein